MTKDKKIAIIGYGYVGKAMANFFRDHFEVLVYDPFCEVSNSTEEINNCDLAVVCVPTTMKEDCSCNTSIVEESVAWLGTPLILIKSAVIPGTIDYLREKYKKRIVVSPEYVGEGKYFVPFWKYPHPTDIKYHNFQIFGGDKKDCSEVIEFFKRVSGPNPKFIITDAKTAEVTKYMENSWGATKVTFCNEFYEIAKAFGVDYNELRELFLLDERVERMHTVVFKENRGFGGKCFPKDVNAIIKAAEKSGYSADFLKEVLKSNEKFKKENENQNK